MAEFVQRMPGTDDPMEDVRRSIREAIVKLEEARRLFGENVVLPRAARDSLPRRRGRCRTARACAPHPRRRRRGRPLAADPRHSSWKRSLRPARCIAVRVAPCHPPAMFRCSATRVNTFRGSGSYSGSWQRARSTPARRATHPPSSRSPSKVSLASSGRRFASTARNACCKLSKRTNGDFASLERAAFSSAVHFAKGSRSSRQSPNGWR